MKRILSILMLFCLIGAGLSACTSHQTVEIPVLTVGGTIEATTGARSWSVKQGFGNWMTQDASTVFPLDDPDSYPTLTFSRDGLITLMWDTTPDAYSVAYWKEEVWLDGMEAMMTEAELCDQGFIMPEEDTSAIVTVRAIWEKQAFRGWYGDVEYIFKVE